MARLFGYDGRASALFVLVMCISFMEAQKITGKKALEQAAHQQTQTQLQKELSERESEINAQQAAP